MTIYKVRMHHSALRDLDELELFLLSVMSRSGANKYIDMMMAEVESLSIFACLYRPSQMLVIRSYHPQARRMVSHNRRWVYIFHIEGDTVIVDRIRPAKTIVQ